MEFTLLELFYFLLLLPLAYTESSAEHPLLKDDYYREAIYRSFPMFLPNSSHTDTSLSVFNISTVNVSSSAECAQECLGHPDCLSVNFQTDGNPKHLCELCNTTLRLSPDCKVSRPGYTHYEPSYENPNAPPTCASRPCKNGATCVMVGVCSLQQPYPTYRCNCQAYNTGKHCEHWTVPIGSCNDIYTKTGYRQTMVYTWLIDSILSPIYCRMSTISGCSGGGWTLVMKANGQKSTFRYDSSYWTNKVAYNEYNGRYFYSSYETKLPTYWSVPFQKICFGFRYGNSLKFTTMSCAKTSLHAAIADPREQYVPMPSRSALETLIPGSYIQRTGWKTGFNRKCSTYGNLRFGALGDNYSSCRTPDSFMGFGQKGLSSKCPYHGNCCTYSAKCNNAVRVRSAIGYILVR